MKYSRKQYYDVISKVIHYNEITENGADYTLNKYAINKPYIELPNYIIIFFITNNILQFSSGNWESGENHYVLNKIELKRILDEETVIFSGNEYIYTKFDKLIDVLMPYYRDMLIEKIIDDGVG